MPLDDLDIPSPIKVNSIQKRFYKSGIILISIGIISSSVLFVAFSEGYQSAFKEPFNYLPLLFGLIPFFFSAIYSYFANSIKAPLKDGWSKVHFYLTIIPLYFSQFIGIIYFHHLYMSGVDPFIASLSPISIFWLIIIIGQIFFLANIFRSLKLTFYKNANYHPTHFLFLFAAFFFILKGGFSYFFGRWNSAWDLQMHDTYYVISFVHINLFFFFLFLLFAGIYYFLNRNLKKPLNPFLSKVHFFLMLLLILYFAFVYLGYDFSVRRYYSSPEIASQFYDFLQNQLVMVGGSFLLAQILFLINFLRSAFISILGKNKSRKKFP